MKQHHLFIAFGMLATAGWFTTCDKFFHVNNDILVYHWMPVFQKQSLWAFPIFFLASIGFYFFTSPFSSPWETVPSPGKILFNICVCTLAYFTSGIFGKSHPMIFFVMVLALWALRILCLRGHRTTAIKACLIMGFFGCFWEGATSKMGYFDYHYTDFFNVPFWLFACYLHAGLLMLEMHVAVRFLKEKETIRSNAL